MRCRTRHGVSAGSARAATVRATPVIREKLGTLRAVCSHMQPLPEDPLPPDIPLQALEALADHGSRVIWGEGRPGSPLMVVLDNPGLREDRAGQPFVCGTRRTLRAAAASAGLGSEDLYVAFLLKRRPTRAYDRQAARSACLPLLRAQVARNMPKALVLMGDTVVAAMLGDGARAKELRGQVLSVWGRAAVVSYHPLAARRRPALLPLVQEDLRRAVALMRP